jgi:hypothetical protein
MYRKFARFLCEVQMNLPVDRSDQAKDRELIANRPLRHINDILKGAKRQ